MKESAPWNYLFDLELRYLVKKSFSLVSVSNQMNQSHTLLVHFARLHFRHRIAEI